MKWKVAVVVVVVIIVLSVLGNLTKLSCGIARSNDNSISNFSTSSELTQTGKMRTYYRVAVIKSQGPCPNGKLRDRIAEKLYDGLNSKMLCHTVDTTGETGNSSQHLDLIMCDSIEEARNRKVEFIVEGIVKNWKCRPTLGYRKWQADIVIYGESTSRDINRKQWKNFAVYHYNFRDERQMQGTIHGIFNSQYLINHVADDAVDAVIKKIDEDFKDKVDKYIEEADEKD